MRAKQPKPHNYLKPLMQHWSKVEIKPGTVHHATVLHDEWCGIFYGTTCDCVPEIRPGAPKPRGAA